MNEELFDGCVTIDPTCQSEEVFKELAALPACKGVILFADSNKKPIQFLTAANIRRTARSRLNAQQSEQLTKTPNISEIACNIFYVCCYNDFESSITYYKTAKEIFPETYRKLVPKAKLNLVKINPSDDWPVFTYTSSPVLCGDEIVFGLFANRKSAREFIHILQEAFSLCKRPDISQDPQKARGCPYLQMETCAGACVGKISKTDYQKRIDQAIQAGRGETDAIKISLCGEMERLSNSMQFELACKVKKQIELIELLDKPIYKWVGDLQRTSIMHVDLSAKVKIEGQRSKKQLFKAYLLSKGNVFQLGNFSIDTIDDLFISAECYTKQKDENKDVDLRSKLLSIFAVSLYRSKPSGIWLNCSGAYGLNFPNVSQLSKSISEFFNL